MRITLILRSGFAMHGLFDGGVRTFLGGIR
jgi:hypothetical protein